ncbi:MAG: hypothetical protein RL557_1011 [archaeon]|jgi:hypothetical protein
MNSNYFIFIFILMVCMSISLGMAAEEKNVNVEQQAAECINQSRAIFIELDSSGFSTQRINDSLKEIEQLYLAQIILKEKKSKTDFSIILPYCNDIKVLREGAFRARDEFIALERFYNESFEPSVNTSSIEVLLNQIRYEITSERYERVDTLIDQAYKEIITVQSSNTALNLFYKTTQRTIKDFIIKHKYLLVFLFAGSIILFYVYHKPFQRWYIGRKIIALDVRKKTIKKLIANTQREYFEDGTLSEAVYSVRIRKFAELIRDIDRQIPLLQEDLERLKKWN